MGVPTSRHFSDRVSAAEAHHLDYGDLKRPAFWNDFLLPSLVLADKKLLTLPLSTYSFYGTYSADYGTIMAGLLLCVIPILILYIALQKQIINGVVTGAVK